MKKRYYSAVIFDVDGLLLDTERLMLNIWKQISKDYGFEMTDELYNAMIGRTNRDSEKMLMDTFGPDFPLKDAYVKRTECFNDYVSKNGIPQKPGIDMLLDYLTENHVPMCVATSASKQVANIKLKSGGLDGRFQKMIYGDDVKDGKPSPEIFFKAAELLKIKPEMCVVVEDSVVGIFAAKQANMLPIMVPDIVYPEPEVRNMTLAVLHSLKSVKKFLENNMAYKPC